MIAIHLTMTAINGFDNDSCWLIWQWQMLTDLTITAIDWSENDSYWLIALTMTAIDWLIWQWQLLIDHSDNDSCWLIDLTMTATDWTDSYWLIDLTMTGRPSQCAILSHTENPWRWKAQVHIVGDPNCENCRKRPHASLLIQSKHKWCTHTHTQNNNNPILT